jgi:hypothetical protein
MVGDFILPLPTPFIPGKTPCKVVTVEEKGVWVDWYENDGEKVFLNEKEMNSLRVPNGFLGFMPYSRQWDMEQYENGDFKPVLTFNDGTEVYRFPLPKSLHELQHLAKYATGKSMEIEI